MFQNRFQNGFCRRADTQSASDQNCIHLRQSVQNLRDGSHAEHTIFIRQWKYHRLIELDSLDLIDAFRHTQKYQSCTAAQSTHGRKIGCACIAPASTQEQNLPETTFVSPRIPVRQIPQHILMFQFYDIHHITPFTGHKVL